MKLQIHTTKAFLRWILIILDLAVTSLASALWKNENYYLQVFFKKWKCIEEKVIWHVDDNLGDFFYFDNSNRE